jgi:hypothetical protein
MRLKDCKALPTRPGVAAAVKIPLGFPSGDHGAGDKCDVTLEEEQLLAATTTEATLLLGNKALPEIPEDGAKADAKQFEPLFRPPEVVLHENNPPLVGL